MRPCEYRSGAQAQERGIGAGFCDWVGQLYSLRLRNPKQPCVVRWVFTHWHRLWWHGMACGGMGRAARGWRDAKERETPSILGNDGPEGELKCLPLLSHVAHTLGRRLVSQGYTKNHARKVPVIILLAHSRRRSLTGTAADRSRRAWREERVSPQTCKWPKQVRLHCLLGRGEVKELRKDRVQVCRVISQRGQCAKDRTRRPRVINQCGDIGRGGEECRVTRSFKLPSSFTTPNDPLHSPSSSTNLACMTRQDWLMLAPCRRQAERSGT